MAASIPNWFHIGRDPRKTTASQHRLGVASHSGPPNSAARTSGSRSSITLADPPTAVTDKARSTRHGSPAPTQATISGALFSAPQVRAAQADNYDDGHATTSAADQHGLLRRSARRHHVEGAPLSRVFYEIYVDRSAFEAHEESAHVRNFLAKRGAYVSSLRVEFVTPTLHGASAIDDRGRVADRFVLCALGRPAGQRLDIREAAWTLTVVPDPAGSHQVTEQGHLRIPADLRHRCGLTTGDRVLLPPTQTATTSPSTHPQRWTKRSVRPGGGAE